MVHIVERVIVCLRNPVVLQGFSSSDALARVYFKHLLYEILAALGDHLRWHNEGTVLDLLEHLRLAVPVKWHSVS